MRKPVDLSAIPRDRWWGRLLRAPLRLLPDGTVLPVLQGPGQGLKWIVGSANHGCWLGSYEADQTGLFASLAGTGDVVYDLGAHVGWYTLIASRRVGASGAVYAFEPLPQNLTYFHRHLEMNDCDNVTVLPVAAADASGEAPFRRERGRSQGRLAEASSSGTTVETVRLDRLVESGDLPPPDLVKMDVEGAETAVLRGARSIFRSARPVVLISTHGSEERENSLDLLRTYGYDIEPLTASRVEDDDVFLARPAAPEDDPARSASAS